MTYIATYTGPTRKTNTWARPGDAEYRRSQNSRFQGQMMPAESLPTSTLELDRGTIRVSKLDLSVDVDRQGVAILQRKFEQCDECEGIVRVAKYQGQAIPILPDKLARTIVKTQFGQFGMSAENRVWGIVELRIRYAMQLFGSQYVAKTLPVSKELDFLRDPYEFTTLRMYLLVNKLCTKIRTNEDYRYDVEAETSDRRREILAQIKLDEIERSNQPRVIIPRPGELYDFGSEKNIIDRMMMGI